MILDKFRHAAGAAAGIAAIALLTDCATHSGAATAPSQPHRTSVACTISTLCSFVHDVGGREIDVHDIVPVGVSPETYEPTPDDVVAMSHVAVVIENGQGLETWLQKLLGDADAAGVTRVVLADGIPAAVRASGNPHLWMDPVYAQTYVREIAEALSAADPAHARIFSANAAKEERRLSQLDRWIRAQIATVPPQRRAMICFHDAWYYFDLRYGIQNIGAIEQSPGQEPSAGYFAHLTALAREHHVRAVFGEPQFSPKLANALASDAGIEVVSELYDDTLGTAPGLSDYEGMMHYDVSTIVEALTR
jgi:manganese/iron transport system substrate-binding protein